MDVACPLADLGVSSQGLVVRRRLLQAGLSDTSLTRAVAAGVVVRIRPRVYAMAPLAPLPRFVVTGTGPAPAYVAHVRAVLLSLGDTATARCRTAAALYGWAMLVEPARTVEVAVPHGRSRVRVPGVEAVQRRSAARHRRVVLPGTAGLWVTIPVQTVTDCALSLPLVQAVALCDSALRAGDVTLDELGRAAGRLAGVRQARKLRRVLELADPESGSLLESVLRVRMVLASLTGFSTQRVLCDVPGHHLRVDFCFEAAGLVVEVDGARWHTDPIRDRIRENALAVLGWRVLRFTWAEVVREPDSVLDQIHLALTSVSPGFHLPVERRAAVA